MVARALPTKQNLPTLLSHGMQDKAAACRIPPRLEIVCERAGIMRAGKQNEQYHGTLWKEMSYHCAHIHVSQSPGHR
jgi:hypothetical protein